MKRSRLFILLSMVLFAGCSDFIEPPLDNRKVNILAPSDKLETNSYQQTFWWEKQDDALNYRLQIVSPAFDSISKLVLDTLVNTDKFVYTLDPGKYQWRVRAENGSSASAYSAHSLTIYPSTLTDQVIQLVSPNGGLYTMNPELKFEWLKLFGATQYRLQIDDNNFIDENNLVANVTTDNLSFIQSMAKEGSYQFRVRAENATENSKWSPVRSFVYDVTGPLQVILSSPGNKQVVAKPVKLLWNTIADAEKYEVYIYKSDSVTLFNSSYPQTLTTNNHLFNAGDTGETIVWKVRAIDKSGNKGDFSDYRSFIIQ